MKKMVNIYLTGLEQLDKHLVSSPRPLDWLTFPNGSNTDYTYLYQYALDELPKDQFKAFMETYYAGGFSEQLVHYDFNLKDMNRFFYFVKDLLEHRIWLDEILDYIQTKPFSEEQNQRLIDYIRENNLQA